MKHSDRNLVLNPFSRGIVGSCTKVSPFNAAGLNRFRCVKINTENIFFEGGGEVDMLTDFPPAVDGEYFYVHGVQKCFTWVPIHDCAA
jgi:hypothetical protein